MLHVVCYSSREAKAAGTVTANTVNAETIMVVTSMALIFTPYPLPNSPLFPIQIDRREI